MGQKIQLCLFLSKGLQPLDENLSQYKSLKSGLSFPQGNNLCEAIFHSSEFLPWWTPLDEVSRKEGEEKQEGGD